jgi:methionine-rich copper-binding protein CopC
VREISDHRTDQQLLIASYWADGPGTSTPPGHWCALAGDLILQRGLDESSAANLMGLMGATMMDAGIACWDCKFAYWLVRPYQADRSITTPIGQPNFPSYNSGHATFSGAASEILAHAFPDIAGQVRSQADEAALSRLYGGIHYRFDNDSGLVLGRAIAAAALADDADGIWASEITPVVVVTAPAQGAVSAQTPTVTATISDDASLPNNAVTVVVTNGAGVVQTATLAMANGSTPTSVTATVTFPAGLAEDVYEAKFTATDADGHVGVGTAGFAVDPTGAPIVVIDAPANDALFGMSNPVTVSGHINQAVARLTLNGTAIPVTPDNHFTVDLAVDPFTVIRTPLTLFGGLNEVLVQATDPAGRSGRAIIDISIDDSRPRVHIESPIDGAVVSAESIHVTGQAEDIILGTVDNDNVTVTVNGVTANVRNATFLAPDVPLAIGANVLTATATDRSGNVATHAVTVTRATPRGMVVKILSGDLQEGLPNAVLSPLRLRVETADGVAATDQAVTFSVSRGDGTLTEAIDDEHRAFTVLTDAAGEAAANWQLGTYSGLGNQRVTATVPGAQEPAVFTASIVPGPIAAIYMESGDQQTGTSNDILAQPIVAWAADSFGNPILGAILHFSVPSNSGAGLAVQRTATSWLENLDVTTDADGRAIAFVRMGPAIGVDVLSITVDVPGQSVRKARFVESSVLSTGLSEDTAISGIVLSTEHRPIAGVTLVIDGTTIGSVSDTDGAFLIVGVPAGHRHLMVNGTTANHDAVRYPTIGFEVDLINGAEIRMPMPIYLPTVDLSQEVLAGGDDEVVLTLPGVTGVEVIIAPHSTIRSDGTRGPVWMYTSPVNAMAVPMPPPNGTVAAIAATLQPSGTRLDPPARIRWPNMQGLPPGAQTRPLSFDHDLGQFVSQGTMTASEDGAYLTTDPGSGIIKAGWFLPPPQTVLQADVVSDEDTKLEPAVIHVRVDGAGKPHVEFASASKTFSMTAETEPEAQPSDVTWTCNVGTFGGSQSTTGIDVEWTIDPDHVSSSDDDIVITASAPRAPPHLTPLSPIPSQGSSRALPLAHRREPREPA